MTTSNLDINPLALFNCLTFSTGTLMTEDHKIYQKVGEILWSLMPENAKVIYFIGMVYPGFTQIPIKLDPNG